MIKQRKAMDVAETIVSAAINYEHRSSIHRIASQYLLIENTIKQLDELAEEAGLSNVEVILSKAGLKDAPNALLREFSGWYSQLYFALDQVNARLRESAFSQLAEGKDVIEIAEDLKLERSKIYNIVMI